MFTPELSNFISEIQVITTGHTFFFNTAKKINKYFKYLTLLINYIYFQYLIELYFVKTYTL